MYFLNDKAFGIVINFNNYQQHHMAGNDTLVEGGAISFKS